jgi:hypothetical protein
MVSNTFGFATVKRETANVKGDRSMLMLALFPAIVNRQSAMVSDTFG